MAEEQKQPKEVPYECDCCGKEFVSHRARAGEKLCVDCAELRRTMKGFLKRGLSEAQVLARAKKLLGVGGKRVPMGPELSLEELAEIGKEIRSFVMLRTRPVAIKLIRKPEDFPEKATFPLKDLNCKVTPCQGLHIVRTWGITLGMKRGDFLGIPCGVFYGLASYEGGKETLVKHWVEMGALKDVETAMKFLDVVPLIPLGEYIGIAMSPLEWTRIKPDVVVIYGNPGQISKLVAAVGYVRGVGVTSTLTGLGGLCLGAVIPALQTGDFKVFIPGGGERGIAMTQDDELGLVIPYERIGEISEGLSGLKAAKAGAMRYPVAQYLHYTAEKHPYVKIEGKLKWQ